MENNFKKKNIFKYFLEMKIFSHVIYNLKTICEQDPQNTYITSSFIM